MSKILKGVVLTLVCLLVITAIGNASEWVVDPNGNPATEFLDLTTALSTLAGYAGTHNIVVRAGNYSDVGLSVSSNITSIVGDGSDVVIFTGNGSSDFIAITSAPSGFELSGMTIIGHAFGLESYGAGALIQNNVFDGNSYGIVLRAASSGNTVTANCFFASTTLNAYDENTNTWDDNYYDDYTIASSYAIGGGGGESDANPRVLDNSAVVAPATVELGATFTADIMWSVPDCERDRDLSAYEFSVTYNSSKVSFVSADYDYDFFGPDGGGDALYPGIDGSTPGAVVFAASNFTTPVTESGRVGTVTFTADVANTTMQINIASLYKDGNNDPIVVGNTMFIITLADVNPPVLTVTPLMDDDANALTLGPPINDPVSLLDTYSDGSTAGSGPFVDFYVDMSGTDDYDLDRVEYSWDGAAWATWGTYGSLSGMAFAVVAPEYLSLGAFSEASHDLRLRLVDAAGLMSDVWSYDFDIDRTGPVLTSIVMSDDDNCAPDAEYTNDPTVDVTMVDDGSAVEMEFYQTGWEGPIAYVGAPQYPLTGPDGAKTLYMRLYDLYNNQGGQMSDAITLDQTAPVPTGFELDGGAASTAVQAIDGLVGYYGGSGAFELNFSEVEADLVCGNGGWTSLVNPVSVVLTTPDGIKEVFYATRDRAGNISTPISDDIELDMTAPAAPTIVLSDPDGTDCSDSWAVDAEVSWTDSDIKWVGLGMVSGSPTSWTNVSALTSPQTIPFTITGGTCNALNTVFGEVWDEVSQISPVASGDIFVDCNSPTGLGVTALDQDYPSADPPIHINWSNDATIDLSLTGMAADVVTLHVSEDGVLFTPFDISGDQPFATSPYVFEYTHSSPVEQANNIISVYVEDCAGKVSATVTDGIYFDLPGASPPVVVSFSVSSADPTNVLSADLAVDGTDDYFATSLPWKMQIWEDGFQGAGTGWIAYSASHPSLALDAGPGDVTRTINLLLSDPAGNVSDMGTATVLVDQTPPSGTVDVISTNPLSAAEWTNIAACDLSVGWDADVVKYRVRNRIANVWTVVNPAVPAMAWGIDYVYGWNYVELRFRDAANNLGPIVYDSIFADAGVPAAPTTFTAAPTGSALLEWSANPDDQYYLIKYNYNGDYPAFVLPNPPAPDMGSGFPADGPIEVWDTEYLFDGPHPDIYIFSLWVVNKAGTMSSSFTASNLSTNYLLGDFTGGSSPDGCLDFENEFFALASAYGATGYAGFYDPMVDIAPTDDGTQFGIPLPDGNNDFDDFILFALNYRDYRCGESSSNDVDETPKPVVSTMTLIAEAQETALAGEEFTIPIRFNNASGIVGYHIVLDYDVENFELVGVEPGAIYNSLEESFFLHDKNAEGIDFVSVALGSEFDGDELALITLRAINNASVELIAKSMDIRDWNNQQLEVEFGLNLAKVEGLLPTEFALSQNYPNPFNPSTVIEMSLPVAGDYALEIYNIAGQLVEEFRGSSEAGIITVDWDASAYSSGIYLYRMVSGRYTETRKMVFIK